MDRIDGRLVVVFSASPRGPAEYRLTIWDSGHITRNPPESRTRPQRYKKGITGWRDCERVGHAMETEGSDRRGGD